MQYYFLILQDAKLFMVNSFFPKFLFCHYHHLNKVGALNTARICWIGPNKLSKT